MRNLVFVTTLLTAPASAFAAGLTCPVPPPPKAGAAVQVAQSGVADSVSLPPPVNPQAQAARARLQEPGPPVLWAVSPQSEPPPVAPQQVSHAIAPANILPPRALATMQPLSADASAAVPALQRIASAGATLLDLGPEHGLRTIFARKDGAFQIFYLAPDGSAVIGGIMWHASGHDVTRDQVAPIPGVIPTIKIGPDAAAAKTAPAVDESRRADALSLVKETTYGTVGNSGAAQLWMFIDPFCSFSVNAMKQLAPYVQAGEVRLSVIPLSVLDYEDQGRSCPAAAILVSEPKDHMVADWVDGNLTGAPVPGAAALLGRNMAVARALHLRGTPTFIWQAADGSAGRADGIPADLNAVIASIRR